MRITLSLIKADVGSVGGHTQPTERMLDAVRTAANKAVMDGLLIDSFVSFTGDDIAIVCSHTHGEDAPAVHQFAWNAFEQATEIAREEGLYGAGQDLLADAPSGNIRGAGPAVAEIEFDHTLEKPRPAESFLMLAADKTGPGAYNLPLYLGFADPMHCAGLMLPKMIGGFRFDLIDMEHADGDRMLSLYAPEDLYHIAALLRDNERFAIDAIWSRQHDQKAVSVSSERLHTIAGEYTGKDDPVALVRTQGIFPAPEELTSPFAKAHYVGGDARGSHNMPLMPVALNTPVTGMYCLPVVSCLAFSLNREGKFARAWVDLFGNPAWDDTRRKAQEKAFEMRQQGFSGPAMLPYNELEYSGFRNTVETLTEQFRVYDKTARKREDAPAE
jgi:fructose 1,6-bisphosphate aldolase/phosphatase